MAARRRKTRGAGLRLSSAFTPSEAEESPHPFDKLRASPERSRGAGFTLLELLVVMTIIAIAFFAVRPGFGRVLRAARERKTVRQLVALFAGARNQAVAQGRLARVICDAEQGAFWAEVQADPAADPSQFERLTVLGRKQVLLPEGLSLEEVAVAEQSALFQGQSVLYFYPDGGADGARLVLVNSAGKEITLELATATGRVHVNA